MSGINLKWKGSAGVQRRVARLRTGDWVVAEYTNRDAEVWVRGPVMHADGDGAWLNVLHFSRGVQINNLTVGGDLPGNHGQVIEASAVEIGDQVTVIETHQQTTSVVRGHVTATSDIAFWVGRNCIWPSRASGVGYPRKVTILRETTPGGGDMRPDLQPLLDRDRYTDEEWEYARYGRCDLLTANYPSLTVCGRPSSPRSYYRLCGRHDQELRENHPDSYGR